MTMRRQLALTFFSIFALFSITNACGNSGGPSVGPGGNTSSTATSTTSSTSDTTSGSGGLGQSGTGSASGSGGGSGIDGSGAAATTGGETGFVPKPPPGTSSYNCAPPEGTVPELKLTELAGGLDEPVQVVHAPADPRLFVVLRDGRIMVLTNGALADEPFLNISDLVLSNDEDGDNGDRAINALAFHPDFATNKVFYVYYNTIARDGYGPGDALLAEYRVGDDGNVADPASEKVILHIARNDRIDHHGGGLAFGGDSMLYLALGDGNSWVGEGQQGADPDGNGQNPNTLLGSLLRIQPTLGGGYTSPAGNLPNAAPEVWDYGLRNPFRMSFDGCTGTLYIGDVGFQGAEEIDIELPGQGGKNYGWPIMEGSNCVEVGCDPTGLTPPAHSYPWGPATTVVGGAVYRGSAIPALRSKYFFADFLRNQVFYLSFDETTGMVSAVTDVSLDLDSPLAITSIANGYDGELYVTTYGSFYSENSGSVYRLDVE